MSWWSDFATRMEQETPLAPLTWFRLGGQARYLFRPSDQSDLTALLRRAREQEVKVKLLGAGANVLVHDDGFDGVVVRLNEPAFTQVQWHDDGVEAGAGVSLMPFSRQCCQKGYTGLEPMAGIPATIGGAIRMNAGGRNGCIGDVVEEIQVINGNGNLETWSHEQIGLGYRHTNLTDQIVVSARLRLKRGDPQESCARYAEYRHQKQIAQPSLAEHSAGCIFKNPPGHSAGALIDQAGLKGTSIGGATVSKRHANFILASPGARTAHVLSLIDRVRWCVDQHFGIELEREIDVW